MAERGDYRAILRFTDARADADMADRAAILTLASARLNRDLPRARHVCDAKGLPGLTASLCMTILAELGDFDRSYAIAAGIYPTAVAATAADEDHIWLDQPDTFPAALLSAPAAKAMRRDPRFLALASRLGLLDYWRSGRLPDFCTRAHEPVCARIAAIRA